LNARDAAKSSKRGGGRFAFGLFVGDVDGFGE
jgi:hypothetical protein